MFKKQNLVNEKTGEHYTKYFYTFNESDQIVGILFGHFAPFTGPNGHGRMVTALKNIGAESFLIVTPENNKPFDDEREMFNATQRAEIIQSYLDSEELNGVALPYKMKRGGAKSQMGPLVALAAEKFGLNIRPVFCFGPDREDLAAEVCNKFGEIKDPTHCEYIVDYERGTSGTKVRQLIKANDVEGICKETGYKTEVAEKLIKLRTENMAKDELNESFKEAYNVRLSFSDFTDAQDFKNEMKDRFDYPTNVSKHQVVHGTTESGNTVFVESFKKIYEASKKVKTDPESMMYDLTDASAGPDSMGDEVYWKLDNFLDELKYTGRYSDISTWESYASEEPETVEALRQYLTELFEDENCKGKLRSSVESILNAIDAAQAGNAKAKADAETMKDPKNIIAAIEKIDGVVSAYQIGKNIWVDLDTEDEFEAEHIEGLIEDDILHNGRQHGRDDLQGIGQWHLNVGTVAEFSEDNYNDLDLDVRDQYQIIIEPAESYKTRREMGW